MDVLSIPLRFKDNGEFVKVSDTSNEYKAQQIRAMVATHKGEHRLFPSFGTDDPTFSEFSPESLIEEFAQFYDTSIQVAGIDVVNRGGAVSTIEIKFV